MDGARSRILIALVAIVAAAATMFAVDVPPRHSPAVAQEAPGPDNFASKEQWWPDEAAGRDTFPLSRRYDTRGATLEPSETAACATIGATIWFSWYADRVGTLELDTNGSSFSTVVAVYEFDFSGSVVPSPPGAQLRSLACGSTDAGGLARLSVDVVPGREYLVQAGGLEGASGDLVLNADCVCAPPNDQIGNAGYLYLDAYQSAATRTVDTSRAGLDPGEPTSCGGLSRTVWYRMYVSAPTQRVVLNTAGSATPAAIAVYDISPNEGYPTYNGMRELACGAGGSTSVVLDNTREYWIQVGGIDGAAGSVTINAACDPACPPYNDSWTTHDYWEPSASIYHGVNTTGATLEAGEPQPCGDIGRTVWYLVTARGDTNITATTQSANFTTAIAAYEVVGLSPPPGQWDVLDCDAAASSAGSASVSFPVRANQGYYVQVGGVDGAGGVLDISFDCDPQPCPPYNDSIEQPEWIPALLPFAVDVYQDTRGATTEDAEPRDCGDMGATVWYSIEVYEAWSPVPLIYSTDASDFDTALAIYSAPIFEAADFASMTRIGCDPGGAGQRARVAWTAEPGMRYLVQVGGHGGARGQMALRAECNPFCPPENDNIAAAWYLGPGYVQTVDTRGATLEGGEDSPGCGAMDHTVWYRIEAQTEGATWRISTGGSDYTPIIAIYSIQGLSPPGGLNAIAARCDGNIEFVSEPGQAYYVQIGATVESGGGTLQLNATCEGKCTPDYVVGPDTGGDGQGGGGIASGGVTPPDSGNGGYLPGARRD